MFRHFPYIEVAGAILAWLALLVMAPLAFPQEKTLQQEIEELRAVVAQLEQQQRPTPKIDRSPDDVLAAAWGEAARRNVPLVVFVGVSSREVPGTLSVSVETANGNGTARILVVREPSKTSVIATPLSAQAGDSAIRVAAGLEVSRVATPFGQERRVADGDEYATGPWLPDAEQKRIKALWPTSLPFPVGIRFYRPTTHAQYTAIVNDSKSFEPFRIDRADNENPNIMVKYRAPGGLGNVPRNRWNSYRGVILGGSIKAFEEDFPFRPGVYDGKNRAGADSPGYLMRKRTAEYGQGTEFVDVLTNADDVPFTVRAISFVGDGKPDFMTMYRDWNAMPAGFDMAGQSCKSCHTEAGSARYGPGVRGTGHVFSFPVMKDGTVKWDSSLPIQQVEDRRGPGPTPDGVTSGVFSDDSFGFSTPSIPQQRRGFRRR